MALNWNTLYSQLLGSAREKRQLISASFELTSRCNLRCKMCYVCNPAGDKQATEKELSADQWIRIAKEAKEMGLLFITLTGGEVFLRPDFKEIYTQLLNMGFIIQIYTNGTLITPDVVQWLATIPPSKVSITLYGTSRETYERVTGSADAYDKTVRAIDMLLEASIPTEIKTTVIKGNENEFLEMSEFALKRNLTLGVVNYVSPRREGCLSDPVGTRLSAVELIEYEKMIRKRNDEINMQQGPQSIVMDDSVSIETPGNPRTLESLKVQLKNAFQCNAAKCGVWVTWNGKLLPCGIMNEPSAHVFDGGFQSAWIDLQQKADLIAPCKACMDCKYALHCDRCPARLYNETGQYDQPAPYLCEAAKLRYEFDL